LLDELASMGASLRRTSIDDVLVTKRYEILESFVRGVRRLELTRPTVSAADIARPIAACLTWMGNTLTRSKTEPMECARLAYEYADDRRRLGYEQHTILTEIGLFRSAIGDVALASGVRDPREIGRASALVHRLLIDAIIRASTPAKSNVSSTQRMTALRRSR
jgi:hypothetical protein